MKKCGIGAFINKNNKKAYYFNSKNVYKRLYDYKKQLNRGDFTNKALQEDWSQLGSDGFEWKVVEYCPCNELNKRKNRYLKLNPKNYNEVKASKKKPKKKNKALKPTVIESSTPNRYSPSYKETERWEYETVKTHNSKREKTKRTKIIEDNSKRVILEEENIKTVRVEKKRKQIPNTVSPLEKSARDYVDEICKNEREALKSELYYYIKKAIADKTINKSNFKRKIYDEMEMRKIKYH